MSALRRSALHWLALACALACVSAQALTNDRDKEMNIHSDDSRLNQSTSLFHGHVEITQGTLKVTSDDATIEQGADGQIRRVVLNGNPAHLEQRQDNGDMMRATAQKIVYVLAENTVDLSGNVVVNQQNRGEFSAAHMLYNTVTGTMNSGAESGRRVHMRILPRNTSASPASSVHPEPAPSDENPPATDHR